MGMRCLVWVLASSYNTVGASSLSLESQVPNNIITLWLEYLPDHQRYFKQIPFSSTWVSLNWLWMDLRFKNFQHLLHTIWLCLFSSSKIWTAGGKRAVKCWIRLEKLRPVSLKRILQQEVATDSGDQRTGLYNNPFKYKRWWVLVFRTNQLLMTNTRDFLLVVSSFE